MPINSTMAKDIDYSSWEFDPNCRNIKTVFISIIDFGIKRLKHVRPSIENQFRFADNLKISCPYPSNFYGFAHYLPDDHKIEIKVDSKLDLEDMKIDEQNNIILAKIYQTNTRTELGYLSVFNIIFHEVLHALRLDNLSAKKHNKISNKSEKKRYRDRVYACADLIYPRNFAMSVMLEFKKKLKFSKIRKRFRKSLNRMSLCCDSSEIINCRKNTNKSFEEFAEKNLILDYEKINQSKIMIPFLLLKDRD
ncbi:hypothetical protein N9N67_11165 [Bacteriovoracaceae bacterium]|nr:hypothetical protein [Bacteriovoracaceae bacterium]